MSERSPRKMKRPSTTTAPKSPTKKTMVQTSQGSLQVIQRSVEFEARGLSSDAVELEHLRTIV